eukprot:UN29409
MTGTTATAFTEDLLTSETTEDLEHLSIPAKYLKVGMAVEICKKGVWKLAEIYDIIDSKSLVVQIGSSIIMLRNIPTKNPCRQSECQ